MIPLGMIIHFDEVKAMIDVYRYEIEYIYKDRKNDPCPEVSPIGLNLITVESPFLTDNQRLNKEGLPSDKYVAKWYHDYILTELQTAYLVGISAKENDFDKYRIEFKQSTEKELSIKERDLEERIKQYQGFIEQNKNILLEIKKEKKSRKKNVRQNRSGYVYLLKTIDGYWKIGRTSNPDDRLATFTIKLPFEVHYEHIISCQDMYLSEIELHDKYHECRCEGTEFFRLTPDQVTEIKSIERM